jgi:hypothetical protein
MPPFPHRGSPCFSTKPILVPRLGSSPLLPVRGRTRTARTPDSSPPNCLDIVPRRPFWRVFRRAFHGTVRRPRPNLQTNSTGRLAYRQSSQPPHPHLLVLDFSPARRGHPDRTDPIPLMRLPKWNNVSVIRLAAHRLSAPRFTARSPRTRPRTF